MPRKGSSSSVRDSRQRSRVLSRLPRRSHAAAAVVSLSMALTMAKAIANVVASARTAPSRDFQLDHHLSTKTLYAHRTAPPGGVPLDQIPPPEGCNPSFIYLLSRHGARYPTSGKMKLASSVAPLLARSGAPALQDWEYVFAGESQLNGQLHRLGAEELSGIGRRYAARFPGIFDPHVTSDPIPSTFTLVRSTQKPRCSASAVAFMKGFTQAAFPLSMAPLERDPLLRFFDMCPAYGRYKDAVKECLVSRRRRSFSQPQRPVHDTPSLAASPLLPRLHRRGATSETVCLPGVEHVGGGAVGRDGALGGKAPAARQR